MDQIAGAEIISGEAWAETGRQASPHAAPRFVATTFASVLAQFAAQLHRSPDAIAVQGAGLSLSYRALDQRANALAHRLTAACIGQEQVVGICLESGPYLVVAMLAVWKAGAAFVPMDAQLPHQRLHALATEAGIRAMITAGGLPMPALGVPVLAADAPFQPVPAPAAAAAAPHLLAYLMFTSGSTGAPRAVAVEHAALANLLRWAARDIALGPDDRTAQLVSVGFDAIFLEIWACLLGGGTVCTPERRHRQSPQSVRDYVLANGITVFFAPTPLGEALLALPWPAQCSLRLLLIGGDTLRVYPSAAHPFQVMNLYGPTENTVISTSTFLPAAAHAALPSIGRPVDGCAVLILDADLQPVPRGEVGEIFLAGRGLARGYQNDPALTRQRFLSCPAGSPIFAQHGHTRLYRTGDFARIRPDGDIEFAGRRDRQVKIRGHRVELAEIEACLLTHPAVHDAAVLALEAPHGLQRLAAYLAPADVHSTIGTLDLPAALRAHAAALLPDYMRPGEYHCLELLPRTANGKTDYHALRGIKSARPPARFGNATQHRLAVLFSDLLGQDCITPHSDFFALGGHSLLTARLSTAIAGAFGITVTIEEIYRHPTLQACAELIEARVLAPWRGAMLPPCVVAIQAGQSGPALFLAAPAGGSPVCYRTLSARLAAHIAEPPAIFGLQSPGLGNAMAPLRDVPAIAEVYIAAMRHVQPHGPYRIGGWSFGATVAWEMAAQLGAQGETVALLALIDGGVPPGAAGRRHSQWTGALQVCRLAIKFLRQIERPRGYAAWRELAQWIGISLPASPRQVSQAGWTARARIAGRLSLDALRSLRIFAGNALAELQYDPPPVDCRCVLVLAAAEDQPALANGLGAVLGGKLTVVETPGTHMSVMMQDAHVDALASVLGMFVEDSASF